MNVRTWMLAVLSSALVTNLGRAETPPADFELLCPLSAVMVFEDLMSSGACCPSPQIALAKTAGAHAGQWLSALARPVTQGEPAPSPQLTQSRIAPASYSTWAAPHVPVKESHPQISAKMEIQRLVNGEWTVIGEPNIVALAGRPASIDFMQSDLSRIQLELNMHVVDAKSDTRSPLLARMMIKEFDVQGAERIVSRPHVLALPGDDAMIEVSDSKGGLRIKIQMSEILPAFAPTDVYPNPISEVQTTERPIAPPPAPDESSAPEPSPPLPRPLPAAWSKRPADAPAESQDRAKPTNKLLFAEIEIDQRNAAGKWTTLSRPHIVAVEGRDATIEIGEQHGARLKVDVNMKRVGNQAIPNPVDGKPLIAQLRVARFDGQGRSTILAEPQIVVAENQQAQISCAQPQGKVLRIKIRMSEVKHNQLRAKSVASTQTTATHTLRQPTALASGVQQPMEIVASELDSRSTALARMPATRPAIQAATQTTAQTTTQTTTQTATQAATQAATQSLTPWISTAPAVAAPPLAPMPPVAVNGRPHGAFPLAAEDPFFARKAMYEDHYQAKMSRLLAHIPDVQIAVDVRLNRTDAGLESAHAAVTFPDSYIEQLWEAGRVDEAPATADELVALLDEVKANVGELAAAVLPNQGTEQRVVIQAYTSVRVDTQTHNLAQTPVFAAASPPAFDVAPWMLGVIAITLLCASIGAAVLFRRVPTPRTPTPEVAEESPPRPPRRRAA